MKTFKGTRLQASAGHLVDRARGSCSPRGSALLAWQGKEKMEICKNGTFPQAAPRCPVRHLRSQGPASSQPEQGCLPDRPPGLRAGMRPTQPCLGVAPGTGPPGDTTGMRYVERRGPRSREPRGVDSLGWRGPAGRASAPPPKGAAPPRPGKAGGGEPPRGTGKQR